MMVAGTLAMMLDSLRDIRSKKEATSASFVDLERRMKDAIAAGDTLGDRLKDNAFRAYGLAGVADAQQALFRGCEERLVGKKGQFALIRYPVKVPLRFTWTVEDSRYEIVERFRIGLVADEHLCLAHYGESCVLTLPVDSYLQGVWPESFMYKPVADKTPIQGDFFAMLGTENPRSLLTYLSEEMDKTNLFIGDDEVRAALGKNWEPAYAQVHVDPFLYEVGLRLGRLILQHTPAH